VRSSESRRILRRAGFLRTRTRGGLGVRIVIEGKITPADAVLAEEV